MRLLELGHLSVSDIILNNLIVHLSHDLLNLLVEQLSVDLGLLEGLDSFHYGVYLLMALALGFLLGEAKHLLVIFNQLVQTVSLVLVQGAVVSVVVLDLFVKDGLEHRFGFPRALTIGETSPLHEVQLVDITLALDGLFYFFGCQIGAVLQFF